MTNPLKVRWPRPAVMVVLLATASCWPLAQAEVYKCVNAAGAVEFSDAPCAKGQQGQVVEVKPNNLDTSEQREATLRSENQMLRDKLAASERAAADAKAQAPVDPQAYRMDSAACKTAKRDYEVTASSSAPNRAMLRARESAMYGACGMREPDRQTINVGNQGNGYRVPHYTAPVGKTSAP
jgi:hypothetical protein